MPTLPAAQLEQDHPIGFAPQLFIWFYVILATAVLVGLAFAAHNTVVYDFELAAARAVQSIHWPWFDLLMRLVGAPGYPPQVYFLVFWIIIALYSAGLTWEAAVEIFATVGIGVVGLAVKILVSRPRPTADLVNVMTVLDEGQYSFPAGHVSSYVAILGFLWFFAFFASKRVWIRTLSLLVFGEMIALIGISRVYSGEHWLSDVIAGYLLGSLWLILTVWLYRQSGARERVTRVIDRVQEDLVRQRDVWREKVIQTRSFAKSTWVEHRASIFQTYLVAAVVGFAILAILAHTVAYFAVDLSITRSVQMISATWLDALLRLVSWFGFDPQATLITIMLVLFLYVGGLKWEAAMSAISAIGISALGWGLKILVDRPRPSADLVEVVAQLKDSSFPSGHVVFYTGFFGFILFLIYILFKPSPLRSLLLVLFGFLVALVGLSRVYLGQHWASDVLGAYLLASVWLALIVRVYRWGKPRLFKSQTAEGPGDRRPTSSER